MGNSIKPKRDNLQIKIAPETIKERPDCSRFLDINLPEKPKKSTSDEGANYDSYDLYLIGVWENEGGHTPR